MPEPPLAVSSASLPWVEKVPWPATDILPSNSEISWAPELMMSSSLMDRTGEGPSMSPRLIWEPVTSMRSTSWLASLAAKAEVATKETEGQNNGPVEGRFLHFLS